MDREDGERCGRGGEDKREERKEKWVGREEEKQESRRRERERGSRKEGGERERRSE